MPSDTPEMNELSIKLQEVTAKSNMTDVQFIKMLGVIKEWLTAHEKKALESVYENSKYAEDRTAADVQDRLEFRINQIKGDE